MNKEKLAKSEKRIKEKRKGITKGKNEIKKNEK